MKPLILADDGERVSIVKVCGDHMLKMRLKSMGLVPGEKITVISGTCGNFVIKTKDSRIAIGKECAAKIFV